MLLSSTGKGLDFEHLLLFFKIMNQLDVTRWSYALRKIPTTEKVLTQKNVNNSFPPFSSQLIPRLKYLNSFTNLFFMKAFASHVASSKISFSFLPTDSAVPFSRANECNKKAMQYCFSHHINTIWYHNTLNKYDGSFLGSEFTILSWTN